jgi:hypothetical protein
MIPSLFRRILTQKELKKAYPAAPVISSTTKESPQRLMLVRAEELAAGGLLDPAARGHEVGMIRNQEARYYTAGRLENVRVEGGSLVIESRKEEYAGAHYASASVNILGKKEFLC